MNSSNVVRGKLLQLVSIISGRLNKPPPHLKNLWLTGTQTIPAISTDYELAMYLCAV